MQKSKINKIQEEIKIGKELKKVLSNLTGRERISLLAAAFDFRDCIDVIERLMKHRWLINFYEKVLIEWIILNVDDKINALEKKLV